MSIFYRVKRKNYFCEISERIEIDDISKAAKMVPVPNIINVNPKKNHSRYRGLLKWRAIHWSIIFIKIMDPLMSWINPRHNPFSKLRYL